MKRVFALLAIVAALSLTAQIALAQEREPRPPTIAVSATGSIDYVPDIARMQLGIRAQAPSASAAANTVNMTANQVVAAIERQGVSPRSIQTSGYNLEYREPQRAEPQAGAAMTTAAASAGYYIASEILQVTTSVGSAGPVLDAAISAGANTSYGLSYQSSNADSLYRTALGRAVQSARTTADAIAAAAHLRIVSILSLSNTEEQGMGLQPIPRMMAASAAPILPGTDTVTATIYAVYAVK
jgi:uncharacterized protein